MSGTDSKASSVASVKAPRTNSRYQDETRDQQIGCIHLAPCKNWETMGCLPAEDPFRDVCLAEMTATYTFKVAGAIPAARSSWRNSNPGPTGQLNGSTSCCLDQDTSSWHIRAYNSQNINYSQRQELVLCPEQDLLHLPENVFKTQPALVIDIRDHRGVVRAD